MQRNDSLPVSTVVKNKWKVQGKIGQGSFGEIYHAVDLYSGDDVAIKVEKLDTKKMVLKLEVIALKKLQLCPYVVRYIHSGRQDDYNFLVMERLGENLADIRKRTPRGSFSLCTTLKLGIQMIDSLEGVHKLGYIHRDIKPSNFVVGKVKKDSIYLIDFGLARKYRLSSGEIRPPRKNAGFRGTARYASINSHLSKELGRRDDMWCVFYVLVEFAVGCLPWRKVKDKEHIGELKERYTNAELVKDLPAEFLQFMQHLQKLGYADEPDYDYLRNILFQVYQREGYASDSPFDWNIKDKSKYMLKDMRNADSDSPQNGEGTKNQSSAPKAVKSDTQDYYNIFQAQQPASAKPKKPAKNVDSENDEDKSKCRCCIM